jgi:uncharacterized protein
LDALVTRNLHFDFGSEIPRHWHGGQKSVTNYFNAMSVFFPQGERFFVASVNAHRKYVTDPVLAQQVTAFCGQEGIHSREHERYNEMLRAQGYPIEAMERRVAGIIRRVNRFLGPRWRLAVTAALEHFTALMGFLVLADPRVLEGAHPSMAALWRWHAAEETEHKSVAFDVYKAAGGRYWMRALVMFGASLRFWGKVFEHQFRMMWADGTAFSPREWWSLIRYLFIHPGGMGSVIRRYFHYYRPSFHPSQLDTDALLAAWRKDFDASPLYRTNP